MTAHTMPRTRTIDFDDGLQSVEWAILAGKIEKALNEIVYETILGDKSSGKAAINMLQYAIDVVDKWIEEEDIPEEEWEDYCEKEHGFVYPQFWDTLIIDSATFMKGGAIDLALKENNRLDLSKSLKDSKKGLKKKDLERGLYVHPMRIQDWGSARQLFQKAVKQWKMLGKNLIIIAHEYAETDDTGRVIEVLPSFIGKDRGEIPAMFDDVWNSKLKRRKGELEVVFRTEPDNKRPLKTRFGCLDSEEEADFTKIREKIAKFYGTEVDRLWSAYHGTEGRKKAEEEAMREENVEAI